MSLNQPPARWAGRPLIVTLVCASILGCSQEPPDKLITSAKAYLARHDTRAAYIELKNALQQAPNSAEARFLLGKALLENDDFVGAAVELGKARDLKYAEDEVVPLLAKALLGSGQPRKVLELDDGASLQEPEAVASFKTSVALAQAQEDNAAKADAALDAALHAEPDHAPALLYRARALMRKRDFDGALKLADQVLAKAPSDADALVAKGDILRWGHNDVAGAMSLYRQATEAQPTNLLATTALLEQLLLQNDLVAATKEVDAMRKLRPGHPQTVYFQARLAAQKGELEIAEGHVQRLLKSAPDDPQVLQLAGAIALQRNELLVAQARLGKLVQRLPNAVIARQMLARAYLRGGDTAKTMEMLEPLLRATSPDAQTLSIAAGAQLVGGDAKKASELFARAAKLDEAGAQVRTGAALARVVGGDAGALQDLRVAANADRGIDSDITLISALMSRRQYDAALKAIDQLDAKAPGKPLAPHLRGQALALHGDLAGARASFEKALAADPNYFPAVDRLAALDWRDKKPDAARARFEAVLKKNPGEVRALVGLAHLNEQAGAAPQEVTALLAKAVSLKPADAWLRRQLIQSQFDSKEYRQALVAAQEANTALPNDPDMLSLLALAQLQAGETNQSIASYSALATLRPKSPTPLLGLADAYMVNKSYDLAAGAVRKAVALAPDSPAVVQRGVRLDALSGHPEAAVARARALQARLPKSAEGFAIEGDLEYGRGHWGAAASAYRAALQREPASTTLAQRVYLALRGAGDPAKTEAFATEWAKAQPADPRFPFFLAGLSIADHKYEAAEGQLRQVLRLAPDNPTAVNNLAWVLWAQKKPGALEAAERANQLAPNQPLFMDTLAMVLADQGQLSRALQLQKKAVEINPDAKDLRLALARLYVKSGNKTEARKELDELAKLGGAFKQQAEVRVLLGQL